MTSSELRDRKMRNDHKRPVADGGLLLTRSRSGSRMLLIRGRHIALRR